MNLVLLSVSFWVMGLFRKDICVLIQFIISFISQWTLISLKSPTIFLRLVLGGECWCRPRVIDTSGKDGPSKASR